MEEVKKISETAELDKEYTKAAIQESLKEIEEQEKKKLNEAIMASMLSQLKNMPQSVAIVMGQGYSYADAMEAYQIMGDNADLMLSYLLGIK